MTTVTQPRALRKEERDRILSLNPRFLTNIAESTGFSVGTVSRTFHRQYKRPNPTVVSAIEEALRKLEVV